MTGVATRVTQVRRLGPDRLVGQQIAEALLDQSSPVRVTTGAPAGPAHDALWVYGRARRGCRRCATPIAARRQGEQARITYRCPRCEPEWPVAGAGQA